MTSVVLTFLRETKVGRVVALTPQEEEGEGLEEIGMWLEEEVGQARGEEGGPGPP